MAAENSSCRFLFFDISEGCSIHFYMPPCEERTRLKKIIQQYGGTISSSKEPGCIKLAAPGQKVVSTELIDSRYITDCISQNKLLRHDDYRLYPDTYAKKSRDDSDMEPADNVVRITSPSRPGRSKYTPDEDMNIIRFILDERLHRETSGNNVWKNMASLHKVTGHPWQSMKDRFRKIIIPNIDDYLLSRREISLITGNPIKADFDEEPGIPIGDELPSPRKRYKIQDDVEVVATKVISPSRKMKMDLDEFDKNLVQIARKNQPQIRLSRLENENRSHALVRPINFIKDIEVIPDGEEDDDSSFLTCIDSDGNDVDSASEIVSSRTTRRQVAIASRKGKGKGKNGNTSRISKTANLSHEDIHSEGRRRRVQLLDSDSDSEQDTDAGPPESQSRGASPRKKARSNDVESRVVVVDDDSDATQEQPVKKAATLVKPRTQNDREEDMVVEVEGNDISPSVLEHPTSKYVTPPRSRSTPISSSRRRKPSTPGSVKHEGRKIIELKEVGTSTSEPPAPIEDFGCDKYQFISEIKRPDRTPVTPKHRDEKGEAVTTMKRITGWLDIKNEEFLAALWMTSGSVQEAVTWILTGGRDEALIWQPSDDEDVRSGDKDRLQRLKHKFGPEAVLHRHKFLRDYLS